MSRFRTFTVVACVLSVALGAVAVSELDAGAATKSSTTTTKVKAAGISLAYPDEWTVVPLTKQALRTMRKRLDKTNPQLGDALEFVGTTGIAAATKLFAIDLEASASGAFANNVNIIVVKNSPMPTSVDAFSAAVSSYYAQLDATLERAEELEIDGKTAYRADATYALQRSDGGEVMVHLAQMVIAHGRSSDVITVTTKDDVADRSIADDVFGSVRYL